MSNFLVHLLMAAGMDPRGVAIGFMVSFISLFIIDENEFSFRRAALTLMAGSFVAGYAQHISIEHFDNAGTQSLVTSLSALIAADALSTIKSNAPTFTRWLWTKVTSWLGSKTPPTDVE